MSELSSLCWSVADLLRGDYRQHQYGRIILPFVLLRRLDCVLSNTKQTVLAKAAEVEGKIANPGPLLQRAAGGLKFYNTCPLDFPGLLNDADNVATNLRGYIAGFSSGAVDVLEKYEFDAVITGLDERGLLYKVVAQFADIDLHPDRVSNQLMGYVFEDLIRRFAEVSGETAGEHFTPREVIRLMVNLLLAEDTELLTTSRAVRTLYDCACGTGGMLSTAQEYVKELNPDATLGVFGQELNPETYAMCRSDMLLKGLDPSRIVYGNSLTDEDGHSGTRFDYMLANPPFGVEWKKYAEKIRDEHATAGFDGRYGAGLPRITDGSFLFLQHLLSKMKPVSSDGGGGSRIAIVFNGSPLFAGSAGGAESDIRRWVIENDWLEGILALPDQLFFNTSISTYFWILTNRKRPELKGRVVLVDARDQWQKMPKSLGEKRKMIPDTAIAKITRVYADAIEIASSPNHVDRERLRVVSGASFGYRRVPIERPLRVRYEVTDERLGALASDEAFTSRVEETLRQRLIGAADAIRGKRTYDEGAFVRWLADAFDNAAVESEAAVATAKFVTLPAPIRTRVITSFTLRDPEAPPVLNSRGQAVPDPALRDWENIWLGEDVDAYVEREVRPHVADAWPDEARAKIGYEIPITRLFYRPAEARAIQDVDADLRAAEDELHRLLARVTGS